MENEKLTFDKIKDFLKKERKKKARGDNKVNYKSKQEEIELKKSILLEDPISQYVDYVVNTACGIMKVPKEKLLSSSKKEHVVQARYYIIEIVTMNTDLEADVMYLIGRDRTSYYHAIDTVDAFKVTYIQKRLYEKCYSQCCMSAYNRFKKEQEELKERQEGINYQFIKPTNVE